MSTNFILCVDDDADVLSAVRIALSHDMLPNIQIEIAQDAEEALELIEEIYCNGDCLTLLITDYIMPNMYGDELLVRMHQRDARTINILLTGQSNLDGVKRAINEAALFRFMEKPFDNTDLVMTARTGLQYYRQARALESRTQELIQLNQHLESLVAQRTTELLDTNDKLRQMAVTDQLTGLYNRFKLQNSLNEGLELFSRYGTPMSVALLDIDHFKTINDTHGHGVGDTVLQQTAALLRSQVRSVDILGRWGGEEFLLICPNTPPKNVEIIAEKLRTTMQNTTFTKVGQVTASFGIAGNQPSDSAETLIARADEALYQSKSAGRNRVTGANE